MTELKWHQLKYFFDIRELDKIMGEPAEAGAPNASAEAGAPDTSAEPGAAIEPAEAAGLVPPAKKNGLIGQPRAEEGLKLGLSMKARGYNIYVSGAAGTGRTSFAKKYAQGQAETEPTPPDLLYVYNFENPKCPKILRLQPGMGKELKSEMEELINRLTNELPKVFGAKEYENRKHEIIQVLQNKKDAAIKVISEEVKDVFSVKNTKNGIYFMPVVDGEVISEEDFDNLKQEIQDEIFENSAQAQVKAAELMRQIKILEKDTQKEVGDLEYSVGLFTVGQHISPLMRIFEDEPQVLEYLKAVKEDVLDNLSDFIQEDGDEEENLAMLMPWNVKKQTEDTFTKYQVNLLTGHKPDSGAPVVLDFNPTHSNLVGEIEYDNEYGNFSTDFMKIKPGLLHKANGGYLILQAQDILTSSHAWDTIRRTLLTGEIVTEPIREYTTGVAVSGIKPEPIPVDIKIIIIGSGWYYALLYDFDDQFEKLFRIRVDFDYEMRLNNAHIRDVVTFVRRFAEKNNLPPFTPEALGKLLEYAARLAERQDRLSTCFNRLTELIEESALGAAKKITANNIEQAIKSRIYRLNMYEEKLAELIEEGTIMIDTDGAKIGQINGLAVIDTGDFAFAKPARITATTYMGKAGIVNIEKEAEMSGSIHDKGMQVLIGYLGQTYAQEFPLSLSCRIGFEQSYSDIDGDSASSTELYAVLSSLARLPIRQDIAVTGSINQHGDIQPIGGCTYKIEGFFELCKKRGLTGSQGVLIPKQNIRDLVLNDEVVAAVKAGQFHIYAIEHVNEGISLLTGVAAGEPDAHGRFPRDTVHGMVHKRLRGYFKKVVV